MSRLQSKLHRGDKQRLKAIYLDTDRDNMIAPAGEDTKEPITIDADANAYAWTTTLQLAEHFAFTIYDGAYEVATRDAGSIQGDGARPEIDFFPRYA